MDFQETMHGVCGTWSPKNFEEVKEIKPGKRNNQLMLVEAGELSKLRGQTLFQLQYLQQFSLRNQKQIFQSPKDQQLIQVKDYGMIKLILKSAKTLAYFQFCSTEEHHICGQQLMPEKRKKKKKSVVKFYPVYIIRRKVQRLQAGIRTLLILVLLSSIDL